MRNRKLNQYRVEVMEKISHGRHGKYTHFTLSLYGLNLKDAVEVAIETVAEMTFQEFKSRCDWQGEKDAYLDRILYENKNHSGVIGLDLAGKYFSFRASPDRWDSSADIFHSSTDAMQETTTDTRLKREDTLQQIIKVFEDFLRVRDIKVPCDDDDEMYADIKDAEVIYGYNYAELEDNLEDKLLELGLLKGRVSHA